MSHALVIKHLNHSGNKNLATAPFSETLVTGVAGFVGSSLSRQLVRRNFRVRGLDNLSSGTLSNLEDLLLSLDFHEADLRDLETLRSLCKGVQVIFHQGALASVSHSIDDPLTSHRSNIDGTLNILMAAKESGVRRVVFAASSSAYGDSLEVPLHEAMLPQPISPYAVQKLNGEQYMSSFYKLYGVETVCLRYFNVFGPFQASHSPYAGVIPKFIVSMLHGVAPSITGNGTQSRDFVFISDVVQANLCAAASRASRVAGKIFNVGSGSSVTVMELYSMIAEIIGFTEPPRFLPARTGDVVKSLADITAARRELGYSPQMSIMDGLAETVAWYRTHHDVEYTLPTRKSLQRSRCTAISS